MSKRERELLAPYIIEVPLNKKQRVTETTMVPRATTTYRRRRRPSKRRFRRTPRRAPRRRPRRGRGSRLYTKLTKMPVPDRQFTPMRFWLTGNVSVPLTGLTNQTFQNSLWDPDFTGFGHQPLWFDQYANMFAAYRVHGIKYRITLSHTTNDIINIVVNHRVNAPGDEGDIRALAERRGSRNYTLRQAGDNIYIKGYMASNKPWGMTKQEWKGLDSTWGPMSGDPGTKTLLSIYFSNQSSGVVTQVYWKASLDLYTEFRTRVPVITS